MDFTRIVTGLIAGLVVLSLFVVFAGPAAASHLYATDKIPPGFPAGPHRINMNANCGGVVNYEANAGFFVAHGWQTFPWKEEDKNAFMSPATTYELRIDGELQKSSMHAFLVNFPDGQAKFKFFVTEDHDGMTGSHTFVGRHYLSDAFFGGDRLDRVLAFECTVTVNFA